MTKIYDQHDQAFRDVKAHVVLVDGELVARVAFKRARSNLRTTCFVHWLGIQMVSGRANGGGYDKNSASATHAVNQMPLDLEVNQIARLGHRERFLAFRAAMAKDGGYSWDQSLRQAGFTVFQAV